MNSSLEVPGPASPPVLAKLRHFHMKYGSSDFTFINSRALHDSGGGGGGGWVQRKTEFFSNIVFEFAELFLVAILVQNHKKID